MQMPYEDVLPYPDFAVHLREHALYRLPEVLDKMINSKGLVRRKSSALPATAQSIMYARTPVLTCTASPVNL